MNWGSAMCSTVLYEVHYILGIYTGDIVSINHIPNHSPRSHRSSSSSLSFSFSRPETTPQGYLSLQGPFLHAKPRMSLLSAAVVLAGRGGHFSCYFVHRYDVRSPLFLPTMRGGIG